MKNSLLPIFLLLSYIAFAQDSLDLSYYLPSQISYDPDIPTPKEVIGHEVGEWHVTHDKLMFYMQVLAESTDRFSVEDRGTTYEGRPLLLLTVTSPENHANIDRLRQEHLALTDEGSASMDLESMPVVIYQGFSIHGNEASGSNAALAYAYYLAAAQGPDIERTLDDLVILLDPAFNPDGLQRFAYWANSNKSQNLNPDPNEREYHEVWPRGRTNHYWFDMNRDWLPVQLPESRARIETYHRWLPNILTDHHEMGTNSTFFFQPGEPSRVHPLTPTINQELTKEIATYHARALDGIGSLYYSEENYDDYYYGKGSTFPDVNGSIGILFEQGSSRGHIQESDNGILTFPFTIRNQFTTALSTVEAARNMRTKLLDYQRDFYRTMRNEGNADRNGAMLFGDRKDAAKAWHLAEVLQRHGIRFHRLREDAEVDGLAYTRDNSYVVPMNQKKHRLIKAIFEKRTEFADSLFYDVSAWTLPLAFDVDYTKLNSLSRAGEEVSALSPPTGSIEGKSDYAYLFEWHGYYSPKALYQILEKGLRAKVAKDPFRLKGRDYDYGTIMIPVQGQDLDSDALYRFLQEVAQGSKLRIDAADTGLTQGIDLGSNDFDALEVPEVALLVGDGIRSYDAGEIWHLFDTRYNIPITKIDRAYFDEIELDRYTDLIIPSMATSALTAKTLEKIGEWVKAGGTLIAYRSTVEGLDKKELVDLKFRKDTLVAQNISFGEKNDFTGAQVTGGAIFEANLDRSHPINFGYTGNKLALFRNTNIYMEPDKDSYNNPIRYTEDPLLSGYISEENLEMLKGSVPFQAKKSGKGKILLFTDNTNFRAFWYGTNKLLMNAIFFGGMM